DFLRRTSVQRPVVEALAHAGAFDALADLAGNRRDRLFAAIVSDPDRPGDQLALDLASDSARRTVLRDYTDAEVVKAELDVLGVAAGGGSPARGGSRARRASPRGGSGTGAADRREGDEGRAAGDTAWAPSARRWSRRR